MGVVQCILVFEQGDQGWEEVFYRAGDDAATANGPLRVMGNARRALLGKSCYLRHARASVIGSPRDAHFQSWTGQTGRGLWPGPATTDFVAETAANYRLFANSKVWRSYLIRGLGEGAIKGSADAGYAIQNDFHTAFQTFFQVLKGQTFGIATTVKGAFVNLVKVNRPLNGGPVISFECQDDPPPPAAEANGQVLVSGRGDMAFLAGKWRLKNQSDHTTLTIHAKKRDPKGTYNGLSRLCRLGTRLDVFDTNAAVGVTSKEIGRPLYKPRGRQSVYLG